MTKSGHGSVVILNFTNRFVNHVTLGQSK